MWSSNVKMKSQNLETQKVGVELLCSSFLSYTAKQNFFILKEKLEKKKRIRRHPPDCPSGVRQDSFQAAVKLEVFLKYAGASRERKVLYSLQNGKIQPTQTSANITCILPYFT